jgi:hypothetical protein
MRLAGGARSPPGVWSHQGGGPPGVAADVADRWQRDVRTGDAGRGGRLEDCLYHELNRCRNVFLDVAKVLPTIDGRT